MAANAEYRIDKNELVVGVASIYDPFQIVVSQAFCNRLLYHAHQNVTAGHPSQRQMYESMQTEFCWPHMTNNVYTTASSCNKGAHNGTSLKLKRGLQLFPASDPIEFVAIEILGPLPRMVNENQYVIIMTDRNTKFTRVMKSSKTSSPHVANVFFAFRVVPFGIPAYFLTDNKVKFLSKFFAMQCTVLGLKHLTTTAYYPHMNELVKRYNRTVVTGLRNYVVENQKDWYTHVQQLAYAYNAQMKKYSNMTLLSFVLLRHPSKPTKVPKSSAKTTDSYVHTNGPTEAKAWLSAQKCRTTEKDK